MAETVDPLAALEAQLIEAATNYQQDYYEVSSDWHRYEQNELNYLKDYIGFAMFGPPQPKVIDESKDQTLVETRQDGADDKSKNTNNNVNTTNVGSYVYQEEQQEAIQVIYEKVVRFASQYDPNGSVFCSTIYNVIFNTEETQNSILKKRAELEASLEKKCSEAESLAAQFSEPEIQVYPVPVFKVKQVCNEIDENFISRMEEKVYYIDNSGRVYDGFQDYLESNTLPICTMVYPKDGKYQIDQEFYAKLNKVQLKVDDAVSLVWLERCQSPADSTTAKILSRGDIATTVVTAASMAVGIASCLTPVGPAVVLASGIVGSIGGIWGVGRSVQNLADRGRHDETINPTADRAAFGSWMGIVGGAAGFAASGSSALLSRAIRTGTKISNTLALTHDVVLVGNLLVNSVGIGFKGYDIYSSYRDNKGVSSVDIALLAGHIFFFSNSVMNIRFTRTIVESSQAQLLKDYESSLRSNRHRKEFQRMARNTRAAGTDNVSSNEEIIRGINKIANKDEFFQAMVRNRKTLSASNARAAFSDGKVTVNSVLTIDPIEFATLPKDVRTEIIRNVVNPQTDISSGIQTQNSAGASVNFAGANPASSASKPTDVLGNSGRQESHNSDGVTPNIPAEKKPNNPPVKPNKVAASQPKDSSSQPSNSVEPKTAQNPAIPKESVASKSNVPGGSQPKDSGAAKPTDSTGIKQNRPSESSSKIPANPKLKASSGVSPSNSAEPKVNDSPSAPTASAGSKSNVPVGSQPKDSGAAKPTDSTGIKQNRPSESSSKIPANPKLKASSGVSPSNSAEPKVNESPSAPKESAGSKSNVPTGTKPKDSAAGNKPNVKAAEITTKIAPNETSYKNFDTSNRLVLNDFCMRHASAIFQAAPPQVADFANVLTDLRYVQNYAIIFSKLLEIGYQIFQRLPRGEEIVLGNVLSLIVEFLWEYVKSCIRFLKPELPIYDPWVRKSLDIALQELWIRVEENIDEWVAAFKKWLKQTFPQSFSIPK